MSKPKPENATSAVKKPVILVVKGAARPPKLPGLLNQKISKTGQTRGADDDQIFQNRVNRNSTVLISYRDWDAVAPLRIEGFDNGFICLLTPDDYFRTPDIKQAMAGKGLKLGVNSLVFYERRTDWLTFNPLQLGWNAATSRRAPLGGEYVARVAATTANEDGEKLAYGYTGKPKGAGIRLYEYAKSNSITDCKLVLEALYWMCRNANEAAVKFGMTEEAASLRRESKLAECRSKGLLRLDKLIESRVVNSSGVTVCPLCLMELNAEGFYTRMTQAEGRAVHDLTVTEINLFHLQELRLGVHNHRPDNLGWGHHHCNVVVKDAGILPTLEWMREVVERNSAK